MAALALCPGPFRFSFPALNPPLLPFRCLLAGVALLFAAAAHAERLAPADQPGFLQMPKQLAVKILRGATVDGGGAQFIGSGFAWVRQGKAYAITNFHVAQKGLGAEGPGGLYVGYPGPVHWHAASHTLGVPGADLAVIETVVESPLANPFTLGTAALGETVYSISYDEQDYQQAEPLVHRGTVVGVVRALFPSSVLLIRPPVPPDAVKVYVVDGSDCLHGASGSMMLNSRGELFAINAGRIDGGLCIAVAAEEMERALAR